MILEKYNDIITGFVDMIWHKLDDVRFDIQIILFNQMELILYLFVTFSSN